MNDNIDEQGNVIPGLDADGNPTGNVGAGNVGVGTTAPTAEQTPAPPPATETTPEPKPSGPIVSDDRDAADAGEVK